MNMRLSRSRNVINDITPRAAISTPHDLEEVRFIHEFQGDQIGSSGTTRHYPLVDVVNPQPKAFFAYLQMPEKKASPKTAPKRVSRRKKDSN